MIIKYPNPILNKKSIPVEINEEVTDIVELITNELEVNEALGIAAVQVGILKRIIGIKHKNQIKIFINPYLINVKGEQYIGENCLSLDDTYMVKRAARVRLCGFELDNKKVVLKLKDIMAAVAQHEIDHLEGVLINDKGTRIRRL